MTKSKKYYWLKLKDDFFTTREVKKLRKVAGGDTYTIIYLKLQLLSIKKEGLIVYEGTEESITDQLALELDEDESNVKMTLAFLHANRLIEQLTEDEYLLNKVPESIGSETGAAERMRKMRKKSNNVTPELPPVTKSYTEIEIERRDKREEIDIEEDHKNDNGDNFSKIVQAFENNGFGTINITTKDMIVHLIENYSGEWTLEAIEIAVKSNVRNLKYVEGILKKWKAEGKNVEGKFGGKGSEKGGQSFSGNTRENKREGPDAAEKAGVISL